MNLSNAIAQMITEMLSEQSEIEIQRNVLAQDLGCVPSQINYVLSSRFTPERGYIVESRRGGGGHIKITRVAMNRNDGIRHILSSIGDSLDVMTAEALVNTLYINKTINENQAKLIITACSNNSLSPIADGMVKNRVRASIFKNLLLMFI